MRPNQVLARFIAWWTRGVDVPWDVAEEIIGRPPALDVALKIEMSSTAGGLAEADPRLDYSVASLAFIEQRLADDDLADVELHRCGAYIGEVLRRSGAGLEWAFADRKRPVLALGAWFADPFEVVDRYVRPNRPEDDTLDRYAQQVVAFSTSPTEATVQRLGWSLKFRGPTASEDMRDRWAQRRRRARRHKALRDGA